MSTIVLQLGGLKTYAFVMPYVLIFTKMDTVQGEGNDENLLNIDPELKNATLEALRKISEHGYLHADLKPTHLGFYRNSKNEIKALLVDLSLEKVNDKKAAFDKMKAALGLD